MHDSGLAFRRRLKSSAIPKYPAIRGARALLDARCRNIGEFGETFCPVFLALFGPHRLAFRSRFGTLAADSKRPVECRFQFPILARDGIGAQDLARASASLRDLVGIAVAVRTCEEIDGRIKQDCEVIAALERASRPVEFQSVLYSRSPFLLEIGRLPSGCRIFWRGPCGRALASTRCHSEEAREFAANGRVPIAPEQIHSSRGQEPPPLFPFEPALERIIGKKRDLLFLTGEFNLIPGRPLLIRQD